MSATMDKMQRRLMMFLPLIFITFIAHFPTGLVLYWVTTNLWTVGQGVVTRRLVPKGAAAQLPAAAKRSSRTPPESGSSGNGAAIEPPTPKPRPPAQTQPRRVKRKKGGARR